MIEQDAELKDEYYMDLPEQCAEAKILKWNERIAAGLTMHARSTLYLLGKAKTEQPNHVGVYIRKSPVKT